MYTKKVLIFNQVYGGFAEANSVLCGMVKVTNSGKGDTEVAVFVTNADVRQFGEWWLVLYVGDNIYSANLTTLNNFTFTVPEYDLSKLAALLYKRTLSGVKLAAESSLNMPITLYMRENSPKIITGEQTVSNQYQNTRSVPAKAFEMDVDATEYEKFVASTKNFYEDATPSIDQLKSGLNERIKTVEDYSTAFERFYATGGGENYYSSVKNEITRLFTQFPPYYPLIHKYRDSFFVRVDFPKSNKFFVVGVVEKDGKIKYICYGVPGERGNFEDKDFTYVETPDTEGFWMLFQDADTGQLTAM
jgi:hypothetical protein